MNNYTTRRNTMAEAYQKHGWKLLRFARGRKEPISSGWGLGMDFKGEPITAFYAEDNIGLSTGARSGVFVVDNDCYKDGGKSWKAFLAGRELPQTVTVLTPSGGEQYYFKMPAGLDLRGSQDKLGEHIDVRANGGAAALPPSFRADKKAEYQFAPGHALDEIEIAEAPQWLIDAILATAPKESEHVEFTPDPKFNRPYVENLLRKYARQSQNDGRKQNAFAFACQLRDNRVPWDEAGHYMKWFHSLLPQPPQREEHYTLAEALKTLRSAYNGYARQPSWAFRPNSVGTDAEPQDDGFHDVGNARRLVKSYGSDIAWAPELNWVLWSGKCWEPVHRSQIEGLAQKVLAQLLDEAIELQKAGDPQRASQLAKWFHASNNAPRVHSMVDMAVPMVTRKKSEFDTPVDLLNVNNGVVDLRTGELFPHDQRYGFTRVAPVDYIPGATCEEWTNYLHRSVSPEVEEYLQRFFGYCLTGRNNEKRFAFLYGPKNSGKSTFANAISKVLGSYAAPLDTSALVQSRFSNPSAHLYQVAEKRLAIVAETEEGQKFNGSVLKSWTGADPMQLKTLYKAPEDFKPSAHILIHGNRRLQIEVDDEALFDRLIVFPFRNSLTGGQIDPYFFEKIDPQAVLAWLIEGAVRYYEYGLGNVPAEIVAENASYRAAMDTMAQFVTDNLTLKAGAFVLVEELHRAYEMEYDEELDRTKKRRLTETAIRVLGLDADRDYRKSHGVAKLMNVVMS